MNTRLPSPDNSLSSSVAAAPGQIGDITSAIMKLELDAKQRTRLQAAKDTAQVCQSEPAYHALAAYVPTMEADEGDENLTKGLRKLGGRFEAQRP